MNKNEIKKVIFRILGILNIFLTLHSKSFNKDVKRNWEIFVLSGIPIIFLTLFSGFKIFGIQFLKIDFIESHGIWIFFIFVICFCVYFFDSEKCKKITKDSQNSNKF